MRPDRLNPARAPRRPLIGSLSHVSLSSGGSAGHCHDDGKRLLVGLPTADVGQKQEMTASKANDISTGVALAAALSEFGGISTAEAGWNIVTPTPKRKRIGLDVTF